MAKEPDDKKPPHLTVVQMGRTAHAPKQPPRIVIKGHETFEHMGMIATMIDGTVHFFDRSYARSIKRTENTIQQTIERNSYELQGYGTLNLVDKVFSIGGNGAEIPFKAYWLNPDQMMIMLMQSSSEAGIEMRRKMVDLKNDIRDGRLVYADGAELIRVPAGVASVRGISRVQKRARERMTSWLSGDRVRCRGKASGARTHGWSSGGRRRAA